MSIAIPQRRVRPLTDDVTPVLSDVFVHVVGGHVAFGQALPDAAQMRTCGFRNNKVDMPRTEVINKYRTSWSSSRVIVCVDGTQVRSFEEFEHELDQSSKPEVIVFPPMAGGL